MKRISAFVIILAMIFAVSCTSSEPNVSEQASVTSEISEAPKEISAESSAESSAEAAESSETASAAISEEESEESEDAVEKYLSEEEKTESKYLDGKKLVVFGDSITALGTWGRTAATELNMRFFNGAMGGITSEQGIARFPAYVASQNPDYVTILFGMNDLIMTSPGIPKVTPEKFEENLKTLINMTKECGATPILLTTNPLNPNMFYSAQGQDKSWYKDVGTPLEWLDKYNDVTRKVAEETGTALIDMRKACEGVAYSTLLTDGIHLASRGNKIFAETLVNWFNEHYEHDPNAEKVSDMENCVSAYDSETPISIVSFETENWYTVDATLMRFQKTSSGIRICNTNGLWPEAHAIPAEPIKVSVENGMLNYDIKLSGVNAALILYFDGATPSAFTEEQSVNLDSHLGKTNEVGDLTANQTLKGSICLSELNIPSGVIHDGYVTITGFKLFVAGTSYQYVTINELSVSE